MRQTSVARLYEVHRDNLNLAHVSGRLDALLRDRQAGIERTAEVDKAQARAMDLI